MKTTIRTDLFQQVMACRVCTERHEIPRRLLRDQDGLLQMQDDIAHDHRECAESPDDPAAAARNRDFRKRIEREERKQAERRAA